MQRRWLSSVGIISILLLLLGIRSLMIEGDTTPSNSSDPLIPTRTTRAQADEPALLTVAAGQLLIQVDPFPARWEIEPPCPDPCQDAALTKASRTFLRPNEVGVAIQDTFRFATSAEAYAYWDKIRSVYDLDVAAELRYRSRYADDEASGCGINRIPICRTVTRYHNVVSVWYFTLDDGIKDYSAGLFLEEVDQVLTVADEHIGTSLQLTPHQ